jgi:hypothetical protein
VAAVIEHAARGPELPPLACAAQTRRYGETAITVLKPGPAGGEARP